MSSRGSAGDGFICGPSGRGAGVAVDFARAVALLRDSGMTQGCVLRHKRKRKTGTYCAREQERHRQMEVAIDGYEAVQDWQ